MVRMGKRLVGLVLCAVLLLGLKVFSAGAANSIYLMAVNDTVVETTASNMPITVGGALHIPYTMLSSRSTGVNLGVSAQYSTSRRTVLVSNDSMGVIFDTQANSAHDLNNHLLEVRAVVRNGMVYLPLVWVCNYFGSITYSLVRTPYGVLVRVTNGAAILSDVSFVDAASSQLEDNFRRYQQSISTGWQTEEPVNSVQPGGRRDRPLVYLAFRCGERIETVARMLEARGERVLFLFQPEELIEWDSLVRNLVAAGHTVGLTLSGQSWKDCLDQGAEGSRLLAAIARCAVLIVQADGLDQDGQKRLAEAGYVLWYSTHDGKDFSSGGTLARALRDGRDNYIEIVCDQRGVSLLTSALDAFSRQGCRLRQATAPILAGR